MPQSATVLQTHVAILFVSSILTAHRGTTLVGAGIFEKNKGLGSLRYRNFFRSHSKMHFSTAMLAMLALIPATFAQSNATNASTQTITMTSAATTVTFTLRPANATSFYHTSKPTFMSTSSSSSYSLPSATPTTQCTDCITNGASTHMHNVGIATFAGVAALLWGSL